MSDDIMLMGKNPNYLGSWDLYDEPNKEITATISRIKDEVVKNAGQTETCTVMYFTESVKPMILNLTNKKMLARLFKSKSCASFCGKRITIGYDQVKAFGALHDALRIRPTLPAAPVVIKCENCGSDIVPAFKMDVQTLAAYTLKQYGRRLCAECAQKIKAEQTAAKQEDVANEAEQ